MLGINSITSSSLYSPSHFIPVSTLGELISIFSWLTPDLSSEENKSQLLHSMPPPSPSEEDDVKAHFFSLLRCFIYLCASDLICRASALMSAACQRLHMRYTPTNKKDTSLLPLSQPPQSPVSLAGIDGVGCVGH